MKESNTLKLCEYQWYLNSDDLFLIFSYEKAPPGFIKEEEERPEDCIPETEGNRAAREFLATAPKKGLWMPLGKEVKVMQCKIIINSQVLNQKLRK